jgi:hypothetical protein
MHDCGNAATHNRPDRDAEWLPANDTQFKAATVNRKRDVFDRESVSSPLTVDEIVSRKRSGAKEEPVCQPVEAALFGIVADSKRKERPTRGGRCETHQTTPTLPRAPKAVTHEATHSFAARQALFEMLRAASTLPALCVCNADDVAMTGDVRLGVCEKRPTLLRLMATGVPGFVAFEHKGALLNPRHWSEIGRSMLTCVMMSVCLQGSQIRVIFASISRTMAWHRRACVFVGLI